MAIQESVDKTPEASRKSTPSDENAPERRDMPQSTGYSQEFQSGRPISVILPAGQVPREYLSPTTRAGIHPNELLHFRVNMHPAIAEEGVAIEDAVASHLALPSEPLTPEHRVRHQQERTNGVDNSRSPEQTPPGQSAKKRTPFRRVLDKVRAVEGKGKELQNTVSPTSSPTDTIQRTGGLPRLNEVKHRLQVLESGAPQRFQSTSASADRPVLPELRFAGDDRDNFSSILRVMVRTPSRKSIVLHAVPPASRAPPRPPVLPTEFIDDPVDVESLVNFVGCSNPTGTNPEPERSRPWNERHFEAPRPDSPTLGDDATLFGAAEDLEDLDGTILITETYHHSPCPPPPNSPVPSQQEFQPLLDSAGPVVKKLPVGRFEEPWEHLACPSPPSNSPVLSAGDETSLVGAVARIAYQGVDIDCITEPRDYPVCPGAPPNTPTTLHSERSSFSTTIAKSAEAFPSDPFAELGDETPCPGPPPNTPILNPVRLPLLGGVENEDISKDGLYRFSDSRKCLECPAPPQNSPNMVSSQIPDMFRVPRTSVFREEGLDRFSEHQEYPPCPSPPPNSPSTSTRISASLLQEAVGNAFLELEVSHSEERVPNYLLTPPNTPRSSHSAGIPSSLLHFLPPEQASSAPVNTHISSQPTICSDHLLSRSHCFLPSTSTQNGVSKTDDLTESAPDTIQSLNSQIDTTKSASAQISANRGRQDDKMVDKLCCFGCCSGNHDAESSIPERPPSTSSFVDRTLDPDMFPMVPQHVPGTAATAGNAAVTKAAPPTDTTCPTNDTEASIHRESVIAASTPRPSALDSNPTPAASTSARRASTASQPATPTQNNQPSGNAGPSSAAPTASTSTEQMTANLQPSTTSQDERLNNAVEAEITRRIANGQLQRAIGGPSSPGPSRQGGDFFSMIPGRPSGPPPGPWFWDNCEQAKEKEKELKRKREEEKMARKARENDKGKGKEKQQPDDSNSSREFGGLLEKAKSLFK